MRLIDRYLPEFDVVERHSTLVRASPVAVYAALRSTDLASNPLVRLMLGLRAIPALFTARGRADLKAKTTASIRLADFEQQGFTILEERPPTEMVIGLWGEFWTLNGKLRSLDARKFAEAAAVAGTARAAWNFEVLEMAASECRLLTETRVQCADARSRRRFLPYWTLIRPGSGLIRRMMLRSIRRQAESLS